MGGRGAPEAGQALRLALDWLQQEAAAGLPSASHWMDFPGWAGFSGPTAQRGDLFSRAVAAGLWLDAADALTAQDPRGHWAKDAEALRALAAAQADQLAAARCRELQGGWRYFPDLPELPPDLDSLAAVLSLFARVAPQHLPLAEPAVALALASQRDGACPTWLLSDTDPPAERARMRSAIASHWGDALDVDVNARFVAALARAGWAAAERNALSACVQQAQQPSGAWPATWYASDLASTELALADPGLPGRCREAALAWVQAAQITPGGAATDDSEGGWGAPDASSWQTATALWLLADHHPAACARGLGWLCAQQTRRGAWRASPWLRMAIGRAQGRPSHHIHWGCELIETSHALRAIARAGSCL